MQAPKEKRMGLILPKQSSATKISNIYPHFRCNIRRKKKFYCIKSCALKFQRDLWGSNRQFKLIQGSKLPKNTQDKIILNPKQLLIISILNQSGFICFYSYLDNYHNKKYQNFRPRLSLLERDRNAKGLDFLQKCCRYSKK